jgi:DHA1 family multidrug resistance protein-like MFS transporter
MFFFLLTTLLFSYFIMIDLIRDTVFGHLPRLTSKGKILPHEEDRDLSLWKRYSDTEKSGRMAHHGHTGEEEKAEE